MNEEITLNELIEELVSKKFTILYFVSAFFLIGLVLALTTPAEFKVQTSVIQASKESSNLGNLSGLAGAAGINLGGITEEVLVSDQIYPSIVNSTVFLRDVLYDSCFFRLLGKEQTVYNYYLNDHRYSLIDKLLSTPGDVIGFIMSDDEDDEDDQFDRYISLSSEEIEFIEDLRERINVESDLSTGLLLVSVKLQDPVACAQITEKTLFYLKEYILKLNVQQSLEKRDYLDQRLTDVKNNYEEASAVLSIFMDRNRDVVSSKRKFEEQVLKSEYDLAFASYQNVVQQIEEVDFEIKGKTPFFSEIEPIKIPQKKSEPKTVLILVFFMFMGGFIGVSLVIVKRLI
ncbi:MAG: hypothetical protein JXR07_08335 [Reichenbachiella sp.]